MFEMSLMLTNLGTAIRSERSALGMSQDELARRAGLHRTYISDLERGTRNPSVESVEKLAAALHISISKLFERAGNDSARAQRVVEILLVADKPSDVDLTLEAFNKAHITNPVHVLDSGQKAIEFLFSKFPTENQLTESSFVVLLDLDLQGMSGIEVLTRLKSDPRTRKIPVILLTTSDHGHDIAACRRLACDEFIVKPLDCQNLGPVTRQLNLGWALVSGEAILRANAKTERAAIA